MAGPETFFQSLKFYTALRVMMKFLRAAQVFVFARFLGPENYGIYTLAMFLVYFLEPLSILGLPTGFTRFIPEFEKTENKRPFITAATLLSFFFQALVLVLALKFSDNIHQLLLAGKGSRTLVLFAVALMPLLSLYRILYSAMQGARDFKGSLKIQLLAQVVILAIAAVALWIRPEPETVLVTLIVSYIIVNGIFIIKRGRELFTGLGKLKGAFFSALMSRLFRYNAVMVVIALTHETLKSFDRWYLNHCHAPELTGIFTAALNLASPVVLLGGILSETLLPHLTSMRIKNADAKVDRRALSMVLPAGLFLVFSFMMILIYFKVEIVSLVFGQAFGDVSGILSLVCMGQIQFFIFMIWQLQLWLKEQVGKLLLILAVVTALNILLNLFLIPKYGIMGASAALLGAMTCLGLAAMVFMVKSAVLPLGQGIVIQGVLWAAFLPGPYQIAAAGVLFCLAVWNLYQGRKQGAIDGLIQT